MGVFSKTCEYAMRAVFYIAQKSHQGHKTGIREIAQNINSPESFLAKFCRNLAEKALSAQQRDRTEASILMKKI